MERIVIDLSKLPNALITKIAQQIQEGKAKKAQAKQENKPA